MIRNYRRRRGLSGPQQQAAQLEVEGRTSAEIGAVVGVSPGTVRNWRCRDLEYRSAVNRLFNERIDARKAKVEEFDALSLRVIQQAIEGGDVSIAIKFHSLHSGRSMRHLPDDLDRLAAQAADEKLRQHLAQQLDPLLQPVRSESTGWENYANAALDALQLITPPNVGPRGDLTLIVRQVSSTITALQIALATSEGEGARALAPSTLGWQQEQLEELHDRVHRMHRAEHMVLDGENAGWTLRDFFWAADEAMRAMVTALVGPAPLPAELDPFRMTLAQALRSVEDLDREIERAKKVEDPTEQARRLVEPFVDALWSLAWVTWTALVIDTVDDPAHHEERFDEEPPKAAHRAESGGEKDKTT